MHKKVTHSISNNYKGARHSISNKNKEAKNSISNYHKEATHSAGDEIVKVMHIVTSLCPSSSSNALHKQYFITL